MDSESNRYTVIISEHATQMLVSHVRFLTQVSETAALRLIEAFQTQVKTLEQFPERSPMLIDSLIPTGKYRKLLLEKRYLLIYQIKETTVYLDAVVDTRQDYDWLV
jgi:plasmid stabilization system protein ParE